MRLFPALFVAAAALAADRKFDILVDTSAAPETAGQAARAKALCEDWYPKIDEILYGAGHPLAYREVRIVIQPGLRKPVKFAGLKGSLEASTWDGVIRISTEWLAEHPKELDRLVIHELTHVVTTNHALKLCCGGLRAIPCFFQIRFTHPNRGVEWAGEAICDYVAYRVFTKALEPGLRLGRDGLLRGYDDSLPLLHGLELAKIPIGARSYRVSYTVGASFLLWLETAKDRDVVRKLNVALTEHRASPALFRQWCGGTFDQLWREFLETSMQATAGGAAQ